MEVTCEETDCVEWCKEVGLIGKIKFCPLCSMPMRLSCERKRWRCCRRTQHATGKEVSLGMLTNSVFSETKLNLCNTVRLLLAWCMRLAHGQDRELADVSERTVHNWYAYCRSTCSKELLRTEFKIGGEGQVVEIDETSLAKKNKSIIAAAAMKSLTFRRCRTWYGALVWSRCVQHKD
ncbi:uncharacterized protein IUM83_19909 [Phytophthora cinnamomi]|uniref:uncharacterized protein n=1 Tax=Phytophthora cinnamomi TaxID=4785 RepID=UPI00355A74CB|nr:hypothetical protein IUM83_19909 [Phytophthora cinnamomi]